MKTVFILIFLFPIFAQAQRNKTKEIDSASYYGNELRKLYTQGWDSIQQSERYKTLYNKYIQIIKKSKNFSGFAIYSDIAHSDYSNFNNLIAQEGFPELNPISVRMGFGISVKREQIRWDLYFGTLGFDTETSKDAKRISTSFSNLLQMDFGIDLLNFERVSLYPYGGVSLRFSELRYDSTGQPNPNYTSLSNMRTDNNEVRLNSTRLGYQYGVGLDYAISYNREKTFKLILFVKAGVNKPFKTDTYKADGIPTYKPGIKQGDWVTTIGIIFGSKH